VATDDEVGEKRGITAEQVAILREVRGLTDEALEKISAGRLRRAVRRLDYPDMPRARQAFRLLSSKDERGNISPTNLARAFHQSQRMRTVASGPLRAAGIPTRTAGAGPLAPIPTAGLNLHAWVALGPGNVGGRTRAIVVHPKKPNTMWAGSAGGGVWRTDDGGGQWAPVDDFMANLAICSLAMDPKNPNTIYAGTGEGFGNVDAIRGAGIFRTTNGVDWAQLPATTSADFQAVNRLAVSKNGKTVLAGTPTGIFRSVDVNRATWAKVLDAQIGDVKFHPKLSTRAVAGTLDGGQAYYSVNGGKNWKLATHDGVWSGRVELAYSVKNPSIVYASVAMTSGGIWRSSDGGKTYTRRKTQTAQGTHAPYLGDQGWYANAIWAGDPTNENLLVVGGLDLWRSVDGGDTFVDISTWWDNRSAHADHHCIVSQSGYNGTSKRSVFFGNDGGIYKAADVTTVGNDAQLPRVTGWQELNNTYSVTQFYGGAGNPASGKIVGGAQDNGTSCYSPAGGSENWFSIFGGDGGWCAADPTDPNVFYGEYVYLNIHRNTDGGTTTESDGDRYISGNFWNNAQSKWDWKPAPFTIPDAQNQNALFIAPFVLDPNNANRILAGGLSLWRTSDAKTPNTNSTGPRWARIKPGIGQAISTIAIAKTNSDIVWVGHENGAVYKTANGTSATPTWQKIDGIGPQPLTAVGYCGRIAVDPKNSQIVYVAFAVYGSSNFWRTTDGGGHWQVSGSLPAAPMRSIAIHPRKTNFVYLGTEVGLFASEDGGASWLPTNEGPTNSSVDDFFWLAETLVCVTHGRGMFKIDLSGV
jgi:hypothetical protein